MQTANDEQIVERALQGDGDAFGELVRRWERRIFALSLGMLGREEEARDATQETFLAAFRNLRGFRGEAKVSSWLHRIAVNQCITRQRRARVRSETALEDEPTARCRLFQYSGPRISGHERRKPPAHRGCEARGRLFAAGPEAGHRHERVRGDDVSGDSRDA